MHAAANSISIFFEKTVVHSSTFQVDLSRFWRGHQVFQGVSVTKTSKVEVKSGRLCFPQLLSQKVLTLT